MPLMIAVFRWHYLNKSEKIILIYLTVAFLTEAATFLYAHLGYVENMLLINIYVIIEMITISLFYKSIFSEKRLRAVVLSVIFLFILFALLQIAFNDQKTINNISLTIESVIIVTYSILTFTNLLRKATYSNILSAPVFWINSGFLLFFSGNLILHLFSQFLQTYAQKVFNELWGFHSALNILLYIIISIGLWKTRTSQT